MILVTRFLPTLKNASSDSNEQSIDRANNFIVLLRDRVGVFTTLFFQLCRSHRADSKEKVTKTLLID